MSEISAVIHRFWKKIKLLGFWRTLRITYFNLYFSRKLSHLDLSKENHVVVNGSKMFLVPNDKGISPELLVFKIHEPLHTKLIKKEIKQGMTCLDVGSNIGYYASLESNLVGENGKVLCIEPSPTNFQYLKKNLKLNESSNTETYNFACGDKDGSIKFLVSGSSNWSRVLDNELIPVDDKTEKIIDVPIKKIDSFLNDFPETKIDLIRMDIEGYELHAFKGMTKTIERFKPLLIIEVHKMFLGISNTKELLYDLKKNGYKIKYFIPRELDYPMVGIMKDVKKLSLENVIQKIEKNTISGVFTLFLEINRE